MARLRRRNDGGARSGPGTVHPVSEQPYELISTPDGLVAQIAVRGQRRAAYPDPQPRHGLHRGRAARARPGGPAAHGPVLDGGPRSGAPTASTARCHPDATAASPGPRTTRLVAAVASLAVRLSAANTHDSMLEVVVDAVPSIKGPRSRLVGRTDARPSGTATRGTTCWGSCCWGSCSCLRADLPQGATQAEGRNWL
jgi:hypothetical protein